jgi:hypothetical protein
MTDPYTQMVSTDDGIKDFTTPKKNIRFKIDDEVFRGLSDLPALTLVEFAGMAEQLSNSSLEGQPKMLRAMFELVLDEDSGRRFVDRMSSRERPIGMEQINDIMPWIMEKYGLRPTTPSSDSLTGSEVQVGGTNSTESVQPQASISAISVPSDSLT